MDQENLFMKLSRQFPLNALRVFEATARLKSFTRAGEELGIYRDTLACGYAEMGDFAAAAAEAELALRDDRLTDDDRAEIRRHVSEFRAGRPVRDGNSPASHLTIPRRSLG